MVEAETSLRAAIDADPSNTDAMFSLGWLLRDSGRPEQAAPVFERMIRTDPNDHRAHDGLGVALGDLGQASEALDCFNRAVTLDTQKGQLWHNRGVAQLRMARFKDAAISFQNALDLGHATAAVFGGYALALYRRGRHREAIWFFERSLALQPDNAATLYFESECYLALGDCALGWPRFESRWGLLRDPDKSRPPGPCWLGDFPIAGKTLLVFTEMGLGDTLQFCRYIPMLTAQAKVVMAVPPSLERLLSSLPEIETFVVGRDPSPEYEAWTPLLSLPLVFGTSVATIPAEVPYLHADPDQSAAWRGLLATLRGRKIGLVWAGSPHHNAPGGDHVDLRRSVALARYAPLADVPGVCLISLQKDAPAQTPPEGMDLHDWTDDLDDFADTAALVDALDLVISVDTSIVHLAGALGKPVWVLNRYDQCWRWLIGRTDSPWYPTARLFQQESPGDWDGVMRAVVEALCAGE